MNKNSIESRMVNIDSVYQPTTEPNEPEPGNLSNQTTATPSLFSRFIQFFGVVGCISFACTVLILIELCINVANWCRSCVCPCDLFGKRRSIDRELQTLPVTSSMDPIIPHAQNAPPSELPRSDDEECCTTVTHMDER